MLGLLVTCELACCMPVQLPLQQGKGGEAVLFLPHGGDATCCCTTAAEAGNATQLAELAFELEMSALPDLHAVLRALLGALLEGGIVAGWCPDVHLPCTQGGAVEAISPCSAQCATCSPTSPQPSSASALQTRSRLQRCS